MTSFIEGVYKVSTFQGKAFSGQTDGTTFVQTLSHHFIYTARFVCGRFQSEMLTTEGPVDPGSYTTAINVRNPIIAL
jgi:hypothetical protein